MPATISHHELRSALDLQQVRLLDVRTPAEFETAHIASSVNLPLADLKAHATVLAQPASADPVVVICQSGQRAETARQVLADHGHPSAVVLDGGLQAWSSQGGRTTSGQQRWAMERQVRLVAGGIVGVSILTSVWWKPARFLAGAIGIGLTYSAVSNSCTMAAMLSRLPYNSGSVDVDAAVHHLVRP